MKVAFITGEYPPMRGGIADHVAGLRKALGVLGISSAVLTSTSASGLLQEDDVFPVIRSWGVLSWPLISRTIKRARADLVHLHYQTGAFGLSPAVNLLPLWLKLTVRIPVITTIHDLREPYMFPKAGPLRRLANLILVRASDAVAATNSDDYSRLTEMCAANFWPFATAPRVYPIPLGVEPGPAPTGEADRTRFRKKLGLDADDIVLCYFGMINWSKGVDTLFKSLKSLLDSGIGCRLLMLGESIGSSDTTNASYKDMITSLGFHLGIADKITWTGYLSAEELSQAFCASDICVLPFEDGSSLRRTSLLAALSHRVPVVTTASIASQDSDMDGEFPSLLDGVNCLMVALGDLPEALAAAVRRLKDDPQLRHRLVAGGLEVAEELSWGNAARKTANMYSELLAVREKALAHG
ncbi:MAG: glycosyltransferase family 1 protein [Dehalococcoidia bacterium]|nr:glycosyltransferase family 1 protein [Dehalococcoidia bacterium]